MSMVRLDVFGDQFLYARTQNDDAPMKVGRMIPIPPTLTLKVHIGEHVRVEIRRGSIVAIGRMP